jgi:trigger factor
MQVKELKSKGLSHELEVTVKAKDIDQWIETKLKEVGKNVRLPGFRPGKVPLDVLRKRYGKAILGEVLESAVNDSSMKALKEKGLQPALQPKIEVKSFDEGKDLTYVMALEVLPKFKVADFKGAKFEKPVAKPEAKSIQEAMERIAKQRRGSEKVEEDRASKKGDIVVIDFHGRTADDNKEHPGMHMHAHPLELGAGQFIPGFEEQLIGKKAGSKVEVKVSFPKEYHASELAGRDAIFDVEIKELRQPAEQKIDDEFAKSLGLDNLAALEKVITDQMQADYNGQSRLRVKKALLDWLDNEHDFEIPEGMVELEYGSIVQQIEREREAGGQETKLSDDDQKELREIAERRVRLGLILSEVGKSNNISVSDMELQKALIKEAQRYPGQEKAVFDFYSKNRNALETLRAPLFEDKTVDYILELAEVKEKEVSVETLLKDEDEEAEKPKKSEGKKKAGKKK